MDTGSNKSLYTLIAVVVFGIFLSLSYFLLQDQLKGVLASVLDGTSIMTSQKLDNYGLIPTDVKYFDYVKNADGVSYKLTGYHSDGPKDLVIPAYIDGLPVTTISNNAFQSKGLTAVRLPDTLITIEDGTWSDTLGYTGAFNNNQIKELKLPPNLVNLGYASFHSNLIEKLDLGLIKYVRHAAFESNRLKELKIPSTVTRIGSQSFSQNRLTSVVISEGITQIDSFALWLNDLKSLTIPRSVTNLGIAVAINNTNLVEFNLPKELESKVLASKNIIGKTYAGNYVITEWYDSSTVHYY